MDIISSRKKGVGCSNLAQALGISRWGTRLELWEQYTGRAEWPAIGDELRVALGEPMEEVLKPFVEKRLGRFLRRDRKEYVHHDLSLVGHVDYRASAFTHDEIRPVVDMKTSLGFAARERFGDDLDPDVVVQMQGYLLLTGAKTAYVAALVPGPELKIFTIVSDPEWHQIIRAGVAAFWHHVETDTPPEAESLEDITRLFPESRPVKMMATSDMCEHVMALKELKGLIKDLEAKADKSELEVKKFMGDSDSLVDSSGRTLCTWKTVPRRTIDTAALKEEMPDIAERFSKTTTSRRFLLAKSEKNA